MLCPWLIALETGAAEFPRADYVLLISFDGLSGTHLQAYLQTSPDNFPNFRRLLREGAGTLNGRCDYYASETVPNHTSMLLGRPLYRPEGWPDDAWHGYWNNGWTAGENYHQHGNTNGIYLPSVWDVVHDHGLRTACIVSKTKLLICAESYDAIRGAPDEVGEDNGRNKVDYVLNFPWSFYSNNRWGILRAVTNYLNDVPTHFSFIHFADLDYLGHTFGWSSVSWSNALIEIDGCLGQLMAYLENHPAMSNRTALIITSDHGGGVPDYSHTDPQFALNYTIPFLVWGPGWPAGRNLYTLCSNRFDPETYRVDYLAPLQPIRNGDAANLALAMLGLPPVPGAPLRMGRGEPRLELNVTRHPDKLVVRWPAPAGGYRLESAPRLGDPGAWQPVLEGVMVDEVDWQKILIWQPQEDAPMRWFRLRWDP
ncbi:MAG: alkaline phosphatase family protein [Verrucomicrobiae bacterium]|nr:alkaline phosphatase family protein [Verrucomicrobiae bacterium]